MTGVEVRVHRVGWCVVAAVLALASCGGVRAQATPTIEYRTPVPTATAPHPPLCPCEVPTEAAKPPATPTPIPIATLAPETVTSESLAQVGTVSPALAQYEGQCGPYDATVTRWWPVITRYPWDACTAMYVISAESDGENIYNLEGSGACGVMQIDPCQYPDDGVSNIAVGYAKYVAAGGWSPWEVIG